MKSVAIIGSRRINEQQFNYLVKVAEAFARRGWIVKTGCADGADYASMIGCRNVDPTLLTLYLPWKSYNSQYQTVNEHKLVYDERDQTFIHWKDSISKYHPAPERLSRGAKSLMARNYGIVSGADLVVAFPMSAIDTGGTGQGMRIADDLNIPLYVVCDPKERQRLKEFIHSL